MTAASDGAAEDGTAQVGAASGDAAPGGAPAAEVLVVERAGGVATLTLNRPRAMNAVSLELKEALLSALQEIAKDDSVRAVLLTGAGGSFCVGQDLKEHAAALAERAGTRLPEVAPRAGTTDDPGAALLHDLRDAYVLACRVATDWDVLGQAAQARHDDDLVALVGLCAPRNKRQVTWLRAQRKQVAAQILRH